MLDEHGFYFDRHLAKDLVYEKQRALSELLDTGKVRDTFMLLFKAGLYHQQVLFGKSLSATEGCTRSGGFCPLRHYYYLETKPLRQQQNKFFQRQFQYET